MGIFSKRRKQDTSTASEADVLGLAAEGTGSIERSIDVDTPEAPVRAAQSELDTFIDGFDDLDDVHDALETALSRFRKRSRTMAEYSKRLKSEAARASEAASQLQQSQVEFAKLRNTCDEQLRQIEALEAAHVAAVATQENLRNDLEEISSEKTVLENEYDRVGAEFKKLRAQHDDAFAEAREKGEIIDRQNTELESLRNAKTELNASVRTNARELDDTQCRLSELQVKYEKSTAFQDKFVADREKFLEERKLLRNEIAARESKLADVTLKLERVAAEKKDLVGRLATEKFSMGKQHDSLVSEVGILKEQNAFAESELVRLNEQIKIEREERKEAERALSANSVSLEDGRRNLSRANLSISEMSLKYASERAQLDQLAEENAELKTANRQLQKELSSMADIKMDAHAAKIRADNLEERLANFMEELNTPNGIDNLKSETKSKVKLKAVDEKLLTVETDSSVKH